MFHREAGVFKTTYVADMALFPLPIARKDDRRRLSCCWSSSCR